MQEIEKCNNLSIHKMNFDYILNQVVKKSEKENLNNEIDILDEQGPK